MRILLLGLLIALSACARPPEPLPLSPGLGRELLANVRESGNAFKNLKSLARVSVVSNGERTSFNQAIVLEKPNRLRLDVLSPFGSVYLQACSDGEKLQLHIPSKGKYFSGSPTPENFLLITRIPVDAEQMIDLLLYDVPLASDTVVEVKVRGQDGYSLRLDASAGSQEIWFDRDKRLVASYWYRDDALVAKVEYAALSGEPHFPGEIRFSRPLSDSSLNVVYTSPEPNAAIDEQLFSLAVPPGVQIEPFPQPPENRY